MTPAPPDTSISTLGPCLIPSPVHRIGGVEAPFKEDAVDRILYHSHVLEDGRDSSTPSYEEAGPREKIYFDPPKTTVGIVTCGGLCPGLNDIIRGIVNRCHKQYGVARVYGFRYGYEGLVQRFGHTPLLLKPSSVEQAHHFGGTLLGSSRGKQDIGEMVDTLEDMKVDILFVIGGDGTLRGAAEIVKEIERRGLKKAVVGIPKTIDNDIRYLDKSFGFETAFDAAVQAVNCAYIEATGAVNGVGLVKLMGRDSGFIACYAALAGSNVDFVLVPEVPFELEGEGGLLEVLRQKLMKRGSAVIVVAEGAGQHLMQTGDDTDASGNKRYGDIGLFLKDRINAFFKQRKTEVNLKYIDPSYIVRSVPANAQDNVYCSRLAQNAVHAAMAGKTNMLVGRWHNSYIHLPLELVIHGRRKVDPTQELWHSVLECTGQPAVMK
ncbi:ATP-dependent 6-phosphofructokinase [Prosthecobacter vanneervenii]|uniref:ATP-dependent 6-phosphofructokinase n=1 Tax=Prosthecobacter vanneervenii TaxID=48466 RepID=A0A7W7YDC4_9BACT|nr:ATP-dependent 6-phosphofructokinase [Prosthecobacter vanneervenii]MBB5034014.1 6-phosphofructokinase 1 [Prosthecobacter vanneervenii]